MKSVISKLNINYRDSIISQETESYLHTVSYRITEDLFLITIINKSNYRSNVKRSAQKYLIKILKSKYLRVLNRST